MLLYVAAGVYIATRRLVGTFTSCLSTHLSRHQLARFLLQLQKLKISRSSVHSTKWMVQWPLLQSFAVVVVLLLKW